MPADLSLGFPLFVPADRPDRFAKALGSGADAVILDLEDAVAPDKRGDARRALVDAAGLLARAPCPVLLRVNAAGTPEHAADLAVARSLPLAALMVAKAEDPDALRAAADLGGAPVVALVESAVGLAAARGLARASARLAFGSFDFAADLGCRHTREALLGARLELVLASRLAGLPAPLDGVTASVSDAEGIRADAVYAAGLGFGGKLLVHPAQIPPARAGFAPEEAEIAWARRVMASGDGAVRLDGEMVDAPVRLRAAAVLRRAEAVA